MAIGAIGFAGALPLLPQAVSQKVEETVRKQSGNEKDCSIVRDVQPLTRGILATSVLPITMGILGTVIYKDHHLGGFFGGILIGLGLCIAGTALLCNASSTSDSNKILGYSIFGAAGGVGSFLGISGVLKYLEYPVEFFSFGNSRFYPWAPLGMLAGGAFVGALIGKLRS